MKLATIDIGTHSVLLLITEKTSNNTIKTLVDEATLTRIGEGMGSTNVFLSSGMERTLNVLNKYRILIDQQGVKEIIAVGTAAFRKATNAKDFVATVQSECGIKIEIISGEQEAELTWKAASTDFGSNIIVVDIGGGSTEIITSGLGTRDHGLWTKSIPIGSVLLTEKYCHSDPLSDKDYQNICEVIEKTIQQIDLGIDVPAPLRTLVATAGTATTLGAIKKKMKVYKHHEVHGSKINLQELQGIIADLKTKTIEERKKIPGLEPGRADVILVGSILLEKIAEHLGFKEITISDRGVRWGLTYEYYKRQSKPKQN